MHKEETFPAIYFIQNAPTETSRLQVTRSWPLAAPLFLFSAVQCSFDEVTDCHVYIPWMTFIYTDIYTVRIFKLLLKVDESCAVVGCYEASSGNFSLMSRYNLRSLLAA